MEINIRMANYNDLNDIIAIEQECFPIAEAASAADIKERFDCFHENFIVATVENQVVGFINGCTTDSVILLDDFYHDVSLHNSHGKYQTVFGLDVLPEYRKNGIAERLLNEMISLSRQRQKEGVVLTCKEHLISYYEKFGFVWQRVSDSTHGQASWNDMLLMLKRGK